MFLLGSRPLSGGVEAAAAPRTFFTPLLSLSLSLSPVSSPSHSPRTEKIKPPGTTNNKTFTRGGNVALSCHVNPHAHTRYIRKATMNSGKCTFEFPALSNERTNEYEQNTRGVIYTRRSELRLLRLLVRCACWRGRWREAIKRFCCGPRHSPPSFSLSFPFSLRTSPRVRRAALAPSHSLRARAPLGQKRDREKERERERERSLRAGERLSRFDLQRCR